MLLTGGLILAGAGTVGQIIAGTLVSLLFLLLTTRVTPFVSDLDDALSFVCNLQQVLLYVVGLGLKTQEAGGTGKGTYSTRCGRARRSSSARLRIIGKIISQTRLTRYVFGYYFRKGN